MRTTACHAAGTAYVLYAIISITFMPSSCSGFHFNVGFLGSSWTSQMLGKGSPPAGAFVLARGNVHRVFDRRTLCWDPCKVASSCMAEMGPQGWFSCTTGDRQGRMRTRNWGSCLTTTNPLKECCRSRQCNTSMKGERLSMQNGGVCQKCVQGWQSGQDVREPAASFAVSGKRILCCLLCNMASSWSNLFRHLVVIFGKRYSRVRVFLASILMCLVVLHPRPGHAASICLPIPTPSGISRVCLDIGEDAVRNPDDIRVRDAKHQAREEQYVPPFINAHRTPVGKEGNIFTRMGIRPFTVLGEARDAIVAASRQRLDTLRAIEEMKKQAEAGLIPQPSFYSVSHPIQILRDLEDPLELIWGVPNIPRSQLVAHHIDPVLVMFNVGMLVLFQHRKMYTLFRSIFLRHMKPDATVVLMVQIGMRGQDSYHLSRTCRTLSMLVSRSINPLRLDRTEGVVKARVRKGASMLTPSVRYAAAIFRNFSRSPDWMHGRAEVDSFRFPEEIDEARYRWDMLRRDEELRGLPKRPIPNKPGEFFFGEAIECVRPGCAGMGLESRTSMLHEDQWEFMEWNEAHWADSRRAAPVELSVIFPPTRNSEQQEILEDRHASNLDKIHLAKYGVSGGYLRKRMELLKDARDLLMSEDQWMAENNGTDDSNLTAAQLANVGDNKNDSTFADIRTLDWEQAYTETYGHKWKQDWPDSLYGYRKVDANNQVALRELKAMARAEKARINTPEIRGVLDRSIRRRNRFAFMREKDEESDEEEDADMLSGANLTMFQEEIVKPFESVYGHKKDTYVRTRQMLREAEVQVRREQGDAYENAGGDDKDDGERKARREQGLTPEQVEVAEMLGLTDEDLDEYRRLALNNPSALEWDDEEGGKDDKLVEEITQAMAQARLDEAKTMIQGGGEVDDDWETMLQGGMDEESRDVLGGGKPTRDEDNSRYVVDKVISTIQAFSASEHRDEQILGEICGDSQALQAFAQELLRYRQGIAQGPKIIEPAPDTPTMDELLKLIDDVDSQGWAKPLTWDDINGADLKYDPNSGQSQIMGDLFASADDIQGGWAGQQGEFNGGREGESMAEFMQRFAEACPQGFAGGEEKLKSLMQEFVETQTFDKLLQAVAEIEAALVEQRAQDKSRVDEAQERARVTSTTNDAAQGISGRKTQDVSVERGMDARANDGRKKGRTQDKSEPETVGEYVLLTEESLGIKSAKLQTEKFMIDRKSWDKIRSNPEILAQFKKDLIESENMPPPSEERQSMDAVIVAELDSDGNVVNSTLPGEEASLADEDDVSEGRERGDASGMGAVDGDKSEEQKGMLNETGMDSRSNKNSMDPGSQGRSQLSKGTNKGGDKQQVKQKAKSGQEMSTSELYSEKQVAVGIEDIEAGLVSYPERHTVATLMVTIAAKQTREGIALVEKAHAAEKDTYGYAGVLTLLDELVHGKGIEGNVIGMELLWTAEPQRGLEIEDVLTLQRMEAIYPEMFPETLREEREREEKESKDKEEREKAAQANAAEALKKAKQGLVELLGNEGELSQITSDWIRSTPKIGLRLPKANEILTDFLVVPPSTAVRGDEGPKDEYTALIESLESLPPDDAAGANAAAEFIMRRKAAKEAAGSGTSEEALGNGTSEEALGNGTSEEALGNGTSEEALGNGTSEEALGNGTSEEALGNGISDASAQSTPEASTQAEREDVKSDIGEEDVGIVEEGVDVVEEEGEGNNGRGTKKQSSEDNNV